jgi:hypothetical protein
VRTNGGSEVGECYRVRAAGRGLPALIAVVVAGFCLALAPSALATSFTWTGESTTTESWSEGLNWAGDASPKASKKAETLTFPHLSSAGCEDETFENPCYFSFNDVVGLSTESMRIDDGDEYLMGGESLAIGKGGITASPTGSPDDPAIDFLELPFELTEAQNWSVSGRGAGGELSGLWLEGAVSGSDPLTVELSKMPAFYLVNETEVGPVKIDGTDTTRAGHENGVVGFLGELNSEDGESVELSHVFFFGSGELGPLTTNDAELDVGTGLEPTGGFEAPSVTLDSASKVTFQIAGKETVPYVDYSQLSSEGAIDLANATIGVEVGPPSKGKACPELVTGQTYTFVSTTGTLSGAFANAPEHGADLPITFGESCKATSQELRISYKESGGGTETVTATVETKPVVTESPASTKVTEGSSATFKAAATGASSVQWQVKKSGGAFESDTTDQGVATNTLKVEDATGAQSDDEYRAVFKNGAGEATTVAATLTVETLAQKKAEEEARKKEEEAAKKKEEERQNEEASRKLGEERNKLAAEEAARAAANTQHEAEAAAAKKHQEEEAAKSGALAFKEGSPDATIASASLQASASGEVSVKVSCPAGVSSCAGTVTLRTLDAVVASAKTKPAILTLGTGSFTVAGGQVKTIVLHLSAKARILLARSHTLHVRVTIAAHNATGVTHTGYVIGTLRAAKAKHGKG